MLRRLLCFLPLVPFAVSAADERRPPNVVARPADGPAPAVSSGGESGLLERQPPFRPTPEQEAKLENRKRWFRDAKFGMFIHWGPYAMLPMGEASSARGLVMQAEDYDKLPRRFNPMEFKPDEWVTVAKAAGMKYMVLTSMHADGFCMWDTKETDHNIMHTPFGRDVLKEFSAACRKQDMPYGFYYSFLNWYHPQGTIKDRNWVDKNGKRIMALPAGGRPPGADRMAHVPNPDADIPRYAEHCARQVAELVKNYGPLTTLWGDVPYKAFTGKEGKKLVSWTRSLQPDILVNDRFNGPGDYRTPEQKPGAFDNDRMWESCMCMGGCWSHIPDDAIKSARQCLHMLLGCACGGGNLLLDVGPDDQGRIDPQEIANLRELGGWMSKYGESIYGTRGGPYKPWVFGGATCKDKTVYLHIRHWMSDTLRLPPLPAKITGFSVLTGGEVRCAQTGDGITLRLDPKFRHPWDTVIVLNLDRNAVEIAPVEVGAGFAPDPLAGGKDAQHAQATLEENAPWQEVDLGTPQEVAAAFVTEKPGKTGCRIRAFAIQYEADGTWKTCHEGKAVDGSSSVEFPPVRARKFRLRVMDAAKFPVGIAEFSLFAPSASR
jgi:alpha-L-fucosidase